MPPSKAAPQISVSIGLSVLVTGGAGWLAGHRGAAARPGQTDHSTPQWRTISSEGVDPAVLRLLDANLDRAREGLRCRRLGPLGLDRRDLGKALGPAPAVGCCHLPRYRQARHTATDSAAGLAHPAQQQRSDATVVAANCARAQEALRVLEEFGRSCDPELARGGALLPPALRPGNPLAGGSCRRQRLAPSGCI